MEEDWRARLETSKGENIALQAEVVNLRKRLGSLGNGCIGPTTMANTNAEKQQTERIEAAKHVAMLAQHRDLDCCENSDEDSNPHDDRTGNPRDLVYSIVRNPLAHYLDSKRNGSKRSGKEAVSYRARKIRRIFVGSEVGLGSVHHTSKLVTLVSLAEPKQIFTGVDTPRRLEEIFTSRKLTSGKKNTPNG